MGLVCSCEMRRGEITFPIVITSPASENSQGCESYLILPVYNPGILSACHAVSLSVQIISVPPDLS
jgi:hypothetical protein